MDRLEAIVVIVGVEEGQLLLAVGGIGGLVDVQRDGLGHAWERAAEEIDHRKPHARQIAPGGCVLQARQAGLAHQVIAALGQPPAGQLEGRIEAQEIQVVAVLVAAGNGEEPRADHLVIAVTHPRRVAPIGQARGQGSGDRQALLDLAQEQDTAVGGHLPAIETGQQVLAANG